MKARNAIVTSDASSGLQTLTMAVGPLLLGLGCYLGQYLSNLMRLPPANVATIWFPGGLLLGVLLLEPVRRWSRYLICAFAGLVFALAKDGPLAAVVLFVIAILFAFALSAMAIRHLIGCGPRLDDFRHVLCYVLLGGITLPAVAGFAAAAVVVSAGIRESFWDTWTRGTLAAALGLLTLPPILAAAAGWGRFKVSAISHRRLLEGILLAIGFLSVAFVFGDDGSGPTATKIWLLYAPLPFLAWAAVRFGPGETSLASLFLILIVSWNTKEGRGPFADPTADLSVLSLQVSMLAITVPKLLLGASVLERRRTEVALSASEAESRRQLAQIQELAGKLITAQEVERARIARDLHDDINQRLAALSISLSLLKRRPPSGPDALQSELNRFQQEVQQLTDDVRRVSHELHPGVLQYAGLLPALEAHCLEFRTRHGLELTFRADGIVHDIPDRVALCLYRVAQEALSNIARHANAKRIQVNLSESDGDLIMTIADDGRGFDLSERRRTGLGLLSLDERVRLIQGKFRIDSHPGQGTVLQVIVPMKVSS